MSESLNAELIHITCPKCSKITSFSLGSLIENNHPACLFCGEIMHIDLNAAEQDAQRKAHELDQSIDSLGSME
jgi:hypothetical protein